MTFFDPYRVIRGFLLACLVLANGTVVPVFAADSTEPVTSTTGNESQVGERTTLTIEGISVKGDDDYPRVLNILPWQPPTVPRRTQDPLRLEDEGLLDSVNPDAMQRHRQFRRTLNPLVDAEPET